MVAIRRARELKIPYLGVCLGMQMAVTEFARERLRYGGRKFSRVWSRLPTYQSFDLMPDQEDSTDKGRAMRLGSYPWVVRGTLAHEAYGLAAGLRASPPV